MVQLHPGPPGHAARRDRIFENRISTGNYKLVASAQIHSVSEVNFMVKLLRACVWMPWRKQAMKDVASCDKPRVAAHRL